MKFSLIGFAKTSQIRLLIFLLVFLVLNACIKLPFIQSSVKAALPTDFNKPFCTQNKVYDASIRTVRCYSSEYSGTNVQQYANPPVTLLGQAQALVLEFDLLGNKPESYQAKIFHCTSDWQLSIINEIEYINDLNEFQVRNYQTSFNTKIDYLHYNFIIPKVKVSGNYLLLIYRNNQEEDRMISQRFMIYENKVSVIPEPKAPLGIIDQEKKQQIDFNISYPLYQIPKPETDLKIIVRQNYRWNKINDKLKPASVSATDRMLYYNYSNGETCFLGGNEYRKFDARNTRFLGYRIATLNLKDSLGVVVETDESRVGQSYIRNNDNNGGYVLGKTGAQIPIRECDYIKVSFQLSLKDKPTGEVYVIGGFSNWEILPQNKLVYNPKKDLYQAQAQFKQGQYDYIYVVLKDGVIDEVAIENSHQMTENNYDILVYYRPMSSRSDRLIGYRKFNTLNNN